MGEVHFLRAYYYFGTVQQWGPIPLTLKPSGGLELEWERAPVSEVYDAIVEDLEFAVEHCPEVQTDYGRVTKDAARHYLAKVLLTRASAVEDDRGGNKNEDLAKAAALMPSNNRKRHSSAFRRH